MIHFGYKANPPIGFALVKSFFKFKDSVTHQEAGFDRDLKIKGRE